MTTPPLPARFGVQFGIVSHQYSGLMARLLERHGLTYAQFVLLLHLMRRGEPARISDIAQAIDLTQSAVTKIVQKFMGLGWVTTHADSQDQRSRPVQITDQGRAVATAIQQGFGPAFARLLDGWDSDDLLRLLADLQRLSETLGQMKAAPDAPPPVRKDG